MKITLCGSCKFTDKALSIKRKLEKIGHEVKIWPIELKDEKGQPISVTDYYKTRHTASSDEKWVWDRKAKAIMDHFDKVVWADVTLVTNYKKNNIKGYIGGNTLMEMGLAFFLKKKIYLITSIS